MSTQDSESQRRATRADEADTDVEVTHAAASKAELDADVDEILAEIDEVLEENAEDFVKSFVQKGGQ